MSSKSNLVAFLYILLRDDVVVGRVEEILKQHVEVGEPGYETLYTNEDLEAMAKKFAKRLVS